MYTDFENFSVFKPASQHEKSVNAMFDQVVVWGGALKTLREKTKIECNTQQMVVAQTVIK